MISDFFDMFRGDWVERIGAAILSLCIALILSLVGWGIFIAADSWFLPERDGVAEVCGRNHEPEWTQVIHHSNGNGGGWIQIIVHPESWTVKARVGNLTDNFSVTKQAYDSVLMGQPVRVRYRIGRFSDGLYITAAALN